MAGTSARLPYPLAEGIVMKRLLRLDKLLAAAGYGSRKNIKKIVRDGKVTVNGQAVQDSSVHVSPENDRVAVGGIDVVYREHVYLMLNKPAGYVSATEDVRERTVLELVPAEYSHYRLFPVGRLDKDTEGLLLLTNDGQLAHDLLAPRKHVAKTYFVAVEGHLTRRHVGEMAAGIVLDDGYKTKPAQMKILTAGKTSEAELTIYEGKFHQIKRMFKTLGMQVKYLKRISMGGLVLDPALEPGQVRELTPVEQEHILENCGLSIRCRC